MHRVIILMLLLILCINQTTAQDRYADSLLAFELRIFQSRSEMHDSILNQKLNFQISADSIQVSALNTVRRIQFKNLDSISKTTFLWNAALISYLNQVPDEGFIHWKRYMKTSRDSSVQSLQLGYLLSYSSDTLEHEAIYQALKPLDSLYIQLETIRRQPATVHGKTLKKIASLIIPGSGLMINGNFAKGFLSLGINASALLFLRYMILQKTWINFVFWGTNLGGKFYLGGVRLLEKEIKLKESKKQKKRTQESALILSQVLNKYPLLFR